MIHINKAILHIMEASEEKYYLSKEELFLDLNTNSYIHSHLNKITKSQSAQKGSFKLTSNFYKEMKEYDSDKFLEYTKRVANSYFGEYMNHNRFLDMNLLFVDYVEDETAYFAMMQFKNKPGYIRSMSKEGTSIKNEILTYASLLPGTSQSVDEFFQINLKDFSIRLKENKFYFNDSDELLISDKILYCHLEDSVKDSLKQLEYIIHSVSDELEEDVLENTLKYKQYVNLCAKTDRKLQVDEICDAVFNENEQFEKMFEKKVLENNVPETIVLQEKTPISMRKHKIKTDSGIEIIIPIDYNEVSENVVINENEDGTITISLKNVGKIIE